MPGRGRIEKRLLDPTRVRRIREGFSWIDRRFVRDGWIEGLERDEILVYFFLVTVADKDGLSHYSEVRLASTLKIPVDALVRARARLVEKSLVAHAAPLYQVLELALPPSARCERSGGGLSSVADVLRGLSARRDLREER